MSAVRASPRIPDSCSSPSAMSSAVHELTHQLLPQAPIHDRRDIRSYEYDSAARREQYFGEMRWDLARPLLMARLGH